MRSLRDLPIRRKLLVIGLSSALCAVALNNLVFLVSTYYLVRQRVHSDVIAQASIVAENSTAALAFGDRVAASETLHALRAKPSIDLACAYDVDGRLFAETHRDETPSRCPDRAPAPVDQMTFRSVRIAQPVMLGSRRVGTVFILGNMNELRERLTFQGFAVLGGMLLATLAAFVIARRLQFIISAPVASLASTAAAISQRGDYALRAVREGDDEVGLLVDAFNDMVGQVDRRERERVDLLRREQEANRLKDEFLAALSHELRTPLNAILGWLQILGTAPPSTQTLDRALGSLDRNARAQMRLIEDLLDVSRIISGKLHLDMVPLDFAAVVESAIDVIRPAALAKHITVDAGPRPRCMMMGDADRLRQVIWNLLSNAVKFTPQGGRVTVVMSVSQAACELTIGDNGVGIPAEFLPYVFDRFRQADGSMTRQHGGLGLGLAIVREVTQAHGGQVRVESGGPGRGAAFTIMLPIVPTDDAAEPSRGIAVVADRLDAQHVLLIDDDPDAREVARAALHDAGAIVETAASAEEGLARCGEHPFDVVVCDIAMPGIDGYEFLRRLREHDGRLGQFTPAIALSAFADRESETRALAAGFQRFLAKPFTFVDLVLAVAGVSSGGQA